LLASATFTNETASGWQEVDFSTPVAITAGTTYVASYHTSGGYSANDGYFDTVHTNQELTAPASGSSGGNGVYTYGIGSLFPTHTFDADNYWVDVVFNDGSGQPIHANNDSGFATPEGAPLSIPASALLANDTDTSGASLSVSGVSNPSNGSVSYDPNAKTITFTPASGYAGPASFSYSVTDGQNSASATVSLTVDAPLTTQTLFNVGDTPTQVTVNDHSSVELGVKFAASANGTITGIRFYKGSQNTGTHVGDLWTATGTLLASATFTNETASGWQEVDFANPVAITAGTTYVASYHTGGNYSATDNYFATAHTNQELTAPSSAASGGNGVYAYGTGSLFPNQTFDADNYWVDLVFDGAQGLVASNDSGFTATTNTTLSIAASALLANDTDSSGAKLSISGVSNPSNGAVKYDPTSETISFTPLANYTGPAEFSYSVSDGQGDTASAKVDLVVSDASLFGTARTPSIVSVDDPSPVELGMKFETSENGSITGIRFYKGPENTGPHTADLWTTTGTLLASATFTNETATGWQEADFSSPVSVTAGTTYIAAYHTQGDYSADPNLFANAVTNGPLTAPASSTSGGNGVYAYGANDLFPSSTFNSTSYAVDPLFRPQSG
jgi:hypothetical protein